MHEVPGEEETCIPRLSPERLRRRHKTASHPKEGRTTHLRVSGHGGGGSVPRLILEIARSNAPSLSALPAIWLIRMPLYHLELLNAGDLLYALSALNCRFLMVSPLLISVLLLI